MPSIQLTAPASLAGQVGRTIVQDSSAHAWNILVTGEGDVNLARIAGNVAATGSGAATTGTLRIINATDSRCVIADTASHIWNILTTGEGDVNLKLVGGVAIDLNAGAAGAGTLRVIHATDDLLVTATGIVDSPAPARRLVVGGVAETTFPTAVADGMW